MTGRHRGGSGEPLLLIHGFSCTWRIWEPVLDLLERDHDVAAITLTSHVGGPRFADDTPASFEALVDGVDCPTRIAWGTKDRVLTMGRYSDRLRRLVPDAEFTELEGLGHTPMYDDPELIARTIRETTARARQPVRATA